jgi:hypothetical protein
MNDEQIKQRIAYLVEHGGLADDPLDEIRRQLERLWWVAGVGCFSLGALAVGLMLLRV